jgi:DNA gyrase subunit B
VKLLEKAPKKAHGTTISWKRDLDVFSGETEYDFKTVAGRLQELAFLNPGLHLKLMDTRAKPRTSEFHYAGGIKEYVADVLGKKAVLTPVLSFRLGNTEIAMSWTMSDGEDIRCYANNTFNRDGGTHLTGFKNGLTRVITAYAKDHNMVKDLGDEGITGSDIRDGIVAVVNVRIPDISFSSQTKDKLVSPRAKTLVEDLITDQVASYMVANPGIAKKIADKAVTFAKAREAARRARELVKRKDFLDPMTLPGKLSDCRSKDPRISELFVVEGASAAGSAKGGRDSSYQAILPLRGKVLNAERATAEDILENGELGTLIGVLGCGIEQTGGFKYESLRYHKILLMSDADVDGAHIRTLLLTFIYRCMPRLIYNGHVYIAQPPLYGGRHGLRGDSMYFTGDTELNAYRDALPETGKESRATLHVQRYKGLGEMNAADLWATTMDPEHRNVSQVTVDDATAAERYFTLLMGDNVPGRRDWIEDNAQYATRLDT